MTYRVEIIRAFKNPRFKISMTIALTFIAYHILFWNLPRSMALEIPENPTICPPSLYNCWLGLDFAFPYTQIYYWVLPILATFPFAGSFFTDRKKGYIKNILMRENRNAYLKGKCLAVVLSSSCIVGVPLLIDLFISAMLLPAIVPQVTTYMFPISIVGMWCDFYYSWPLLYIFAFILIDMLFISCFVLTSLIVSRFCKYEVEALLFPSLINLIIYFICSWWGETQYSSAYFLIPYQPSLNTSIYIVLFEFVVLSLINCFLFYHWGKKHDISL